MDRLAIALAYYRNPDMLREQQRVIGSYPEAIRKLTRLIVADDASPDDPAHEAVVEPNGYALEIYRINEPTPWGQLRARNLGMRVALPGSWVLATDIDHVLPPESAERLLALEPRPGRYYTLARQMPDGTSTKPHPNSYVINREWFWDVVGGCDERFVGWYATDSIFRRRARMCGKPVHLQDVQLRVYNRNGVDIGGVEGSATQEWGRKHSRWHARSNPKVMRLMRTAHMQKPERVLDFTWERMR